METKTHNQMFSTNDKVIRVALRKSVLDKELERYRKKGHKAEIFEELGVRHGTARIDLAIINGVMCGYEIKSDRDTLERLPEQVEEFNSVFDKMTLVVGKRHLYHAMHIIPDWWGVMIAKTDDNDRVVFQTIRKPEQNKKQKGISIARLLWREEALGILEEQNEADEVRHKPREFVYEKLANVLETSVLKKHVSSLLVSREGWRSDPQLAINGG
ncbi:MAG: sce7726 family protein [bacterium]|nr:sce7726 family protein [bacterium]